ncbi:TonB-dependent receptor [soil metagenome]
MRPELYLSAATAALILSASAATAQPIDDLSSSLSAADATQVDDVIITANRSPQAATRVGQSVTVLTERDIVASQTVVVADLLSRTPGVTVTRNGGVGSATSVRIRGAETDQTLVVVDGVKLNDPSAVGGGYDFGNLLTGDVTRIEVLRGAQSTLWGSQAIGGVVNIVTAQPTRPFESSIDAEAGSRDTQYLRGGIGGAGEHATWRLAASQYTTDGVSAFAGGNEADGYENFGVSGRADIRVTDDVSVDLRAVYSDGTTDFDGFAPPTYAFGDTREYGTTKTLVGYAGVNFDLFANRLKNRIGYGYTDTDRVNHNPDQAVTDLTFLAKGRNERVEYQGVFDVREGWTATFGAEHEDASFATSAPADYDPTPASQTADASIDGYYAQLQAEVVPGLTLTGGIRRDQHDTFGGKTLGQAAVAWVVNGGDTVVRASFGQGFKAPSLYQLYSDYGNTALNPEEADGYDAGIEQYLFDRRVVLSATYFARDTSNQIDFVSCNFPTSPDPLCSVGGFPRFGYYDNIAKTEAQGLELAGSARLAGVVIDTNYTLTDTENRSSGGNLGRDLARRPRDTANLSVSYVWPFALSTSVAVQYVGDSFDNAANTNRIDGYTLVDLRVSYPINDTLEVYGRIENVGDERYETVRNYGAPGRGTFVGVRARF